jgi:hypothetical protein
MLHILRDLNLRSSVFWGITPCSPVKVNRRFGRTCRVHVQGGRIGQGRNLCKALLATCFTLVSGLDSYPSILYMEATCFSETSVDFQRTKRRYIPEDSIVHCHRFENLEP